MPSFRLTSRINWFASNSEASTAPLGISDSHSHIGIGELVFGKGSSTGQDDKTTPLHTAATHGNTCLAELLLDSTPQLKGRTGGVMQLLINSASIDARDKAKNTPLHLAAQYGHIDMVDLLLSKGASIEAKCPYGKTPLHYAAQGDHTETIKLLLKRGASIEAKLGSGRTPLHWAAYHGRTKAVRLLLEKGAPINTRNNKNNQTPLHDAVEQSHIDMVKLLLEEGASIGVRDIFNETPLDIAERRKKTEIFQLLEKTRVSKMHTHHHRA